MKTLLILTSALVLTAAPARAFVSELRLGVLGHDVGVFGGEHEDGTDIDAEVLFDSPPVLASIWAPRPHVGASINTQGDTSVAYAGLTWTWDATRNVFVDFSFGGAVHNGELDSNRADRIDLGSRVLFRESISVGIRLDEHHSLSLMLSHVSNANLADHNEGMDQVGLRWGYTF